MFYNTKIIDDSIANVFHCCATLETIAASCCMPERSANMNQAQFSLTEMNTLLTTIHSDINAINKIKTVIGELGSQLGFLYASCCTTSRESLYQSLFKQLMILNANMDALTGQAH